MMYSLLVKVILVASLIAPPIQLTGEVVQSVQRNKCDFSKYRPLVLSHPLVNAATKRVEPEYPEIAKRAKVQGTVEVRILVNRSGDVLDACVVAGPSLLQSAARSAALKWKFKKNFGFTYKPKRRYVESSIEFNFKLNPESQ